MGVRRKGSGGLAGRDPKEGVAAINDHDPKALYDQWVFEHPDACTWTPVQSGSKVRRVWRRVRIGNLYDGLPAAQGVLPAPWSRS